MLQYYNYLREYMSKKWYVETTSDKVWIACSNGSKCIGIGRVYVSKEMSESSIICEGCKNPKEFAGNFHGD